MLCLLEYLTSVNHSYYKSSSRLHIYNNVSGPFCLSHQFSHSHHVISLLFSIYHNRQPCKPSLLGSYQLESVCIAKTCRTIR